MRVGSAGGGAGGDGAGAWPGAQLRQHQYFVAPDWSGGIYATPAVAGSRPGALIAGTWAAMMYMGKEVPPPAPAARPALLPA